MRATVVGLLVGVGIMGAINGALSHRPLYAQRFDGSDTSGPTRGDLVAIAGSVVNQQQLLVIMDAERQTLASYQVDAQTGQIALRSVRDVRWDLQMDYFNGTEPSPEKIQALLE